MQLTIGLDLGTTKLCAAAVNPSTRQLVAEVSCPNAAGQGRPAGEQDASKIVSLILNLLRQLMQQPPLQHASIIGLGVTGQMHGIVLVDADGQPASPLVNWQDQRGAVPLSALGQRTPVQALTDQLGDRAPASTGCLPATGYGGVTLTRWAAEGRSFAGLRALSIMDLVVHALCGQYVTDAGIAGSWGLLDAAAGQWLDSASQQFGNLLPPIAPTGSVAGSLRSALATQLDLPSGLPIAVALGDNQASFIGSVDQLDGRLLLNLGTGGQMSLAVSRYAVAEGLETRPLSPGRWLLVGASLCGGRAYALLADFFADVVRTFAGTEIPPALLYERMNQLAQPDQPTTLRASTLLGGTRSDPTARGAITNLDPQNFSAGQFVRAFVAGMVAELRGYYARAEAQGLHATHLLGAGNAVRRNPAVQREITEQFRLPVQMPDTREEAAVGAALTAAVAVGLRSW